MPINVSFLIYNTFYLINNCFIKTDLIRFVRHGHSEKSKLSAIYKCFIRSMIKNGFKKINPLVLKDKPSSDDINWCYRITKFIKCPKLFHFKTSNSSNNQNG